MKIAFRPLLFLVVLSATNLFAQQNGNSISLSGKWMFRIDTSDLGEKEQWYKKQLNDHVLLPGSMATNDKGFDVTVNTEWTGQIVDSSWFLNASYAKYREPGNVKIPFWLQPNKYYKGAAWYQKTVDIPLSWKGHSAELFIERAHWQTKAWIDDTEIGTCNSLATPHIYYLPPGIKPGKHTITILVDNRIHAINPGPNSHSLTDHTQTNWNGMIGRLTLSALPLITSENMQVFSDIKNKKAIVKFKLKNSGHNTSTVKLTFWLNCNYGKNSALPVATKMVDVTDSMEVEIPLPVLNPIPWDEFHPNIYTLTVQLESNGQILEKSKCRFGMRTIAANGRQFTMNGRPIFLRGTLECAIFPLTGYPVTGIDQWMQIFKKARSYGLNHMRFHSWCPPEAAFAAADSMGFYLQVEIDSWANTGSSVGDGRPIDQYLYEESNRIVNSYGNHPSFCLMAYGNEPAGKNLTAYLTEFVNYWQQKDSRRLYTTGAGWPVITQSDYNSTPEPRIQHWGAGVNSIINKEAPKTDYDWKNVISKWAQPTVSHEIGQWCVYPDFKEIKKYTGILKAKNFEIFRDKLRENHLSNLADSFLLASGKLQVLCYKADIEAALRTPGFGGFQLLDLHDFPGQGTALVGVLNPFWQDKGYVTATQYSQFCNSVVPLVRFSKMIFLNNETLKVPVEIANFSQGPLRNDPAVWEIKDAKGKTLFKGSFPKKEIPVGNNIFIGEITQSLAAVSTASMLTVTVKLKSHQNSWQIFVYPAQLPEVEKNIRVTQRLDDAAIQDLEKGGSVLLTASRGSVKPDKGGTINIGFSSIFWNTAWTRGQAPGTLGILCDPRHPSLKNFPGNYYSNYQWWDAMSHCSAILLDSVAPGLQPIIRVIDDWVSARSIGLVFECKVGKGKLLFSSIDLLTDQASRPEARQLLYSLKKYMSEQTFRPAVQVSAAKLIGLLNE